MINLLKKEFDIGLSKYCMTVMLRREFQYSNKQLLDKKVRTLCCISKEAGIEPIFDIPGITKGYLFASKKNAYFIVLLGSTPYSYDIGIAQPFFSVYENKYISYEPGSITISDSAIIEIMEDVFDDIINKQLPCDKAGCKCIHLANKGNCTGPNYEE